MDIVFTPKDPFYLYAALAWAVVHYGLLPRLLPWRIRRWPNVPAMLMHEFAHWLVAFALWGFPRVSFQQGPDEDGCPTVAHVRWDWHVLCLFGVGWLGNALIAIAPFVAGLGLAYYIADQQFTQEQPLWYGIGWLTLFCVCIESVNMISNSDFKGLGLLGKGAFLYAVLQIFVFGLGVLIGWTMEQFDAGIMSWLVETAIPWFDSTIRAMLDSVARPG